MRYCIFSPMNCIPGRFKCEVCSIPTSRHKRYDDPPERFCPTPPEPPYDDNIADFIESHICSPCPRQKLGHCWPATRKRTGCRGPLIKEMLQRGIDCPEGNF